MAGNLRRAWSPIVATAAALALAAPVLGADSNAQPTLRDARGRVSRVSETLSSDAGPWLDLRVRFDDGTEVTLRLGPAAAIRDAAWTVATGQDVRVRYFVGGQEPADVQRIRNESTGRVLRLRCIHGEPLWDAGGRMERGRGSGGGPGPPDRGGQRGQGGSRD